MDFLANTVSEGLVAVESQVILHNHMEKLIANMINEELSKYKEVIFICSSLNILSKNIRDEFSSRITFVVSSFDRLYHDYQQYKSELKDNTIISFDTIQKNRQSLSYKVNALGAIKRSLEVNDRMVLLEESFVALSSVIDFYGKLRNLPQEIITVDIIKGSPINAKIFYYNLNQKVYGPHAASHKCDFIDNGFGREKWCRFNGCPNKIMLK